MYSILKNLGVKRFLLQEMPALSLSLLLAEMAYKFGSFMLECGAFLSTWYLFSMVINQVRSLKKP